MKLTNTKRKFGFDLFELQSFKSNNDFYFYDSIDGLANFQLILFCDAKDLTKTWYFIHSKDKLTEPSMMIDFGNLEDISLNEAKQKFLYIRDMHISMSDGYIDDEEFKKALQPYVRYISEQLLTKKEAFVVLRKMLLLKNCQIFLLQNINEVVEDFNFFNEGADFVGYKLIPTTIQTVFNPDGFQPLTAIDNKLIPTLFYIFYIEEGEIDPNIVRYQMSRHVGTSVNIIISNNIDVILTKISCY